MTFSMRVEMINDQGKAIEAWIIPVDQTFEYHAMATDIYPKGWLGFRLHHNWLGNMVANQNEDSGSGPIMSDEEDEDEDFEEEDDWEDEYDDNDHHYPS